MVQRGEHLGFALEARQAFGIERELLRQNLDRDVAIQLRVARAIHLAHAARADLGDDFIRARDECRAQDSWHGFYANVLRNRRVIGLRTATAR